MGNDITLAGIQYGIVPGTYEKRNRRSGMRAAGWERITIDRFAGQRMPYGGDLSAGWDSVGVGPVWDGAAVEPFPATLVSSSEGLSDTPTSATVAYGLVVGDKLYVGLGRRIYQSVSLGAGSWSAFTVAADLGSGFTISGLAYYQDDILIMLSTGQDIRKLNTSSNAVTIWRSGEKGMAGCGYAGQLVYAPRAANATDELRISGTKWNGNAVTHTRYLDGPILCMCNYSGAVAIATKRSLYLLGGQNYPGEADDAAVTADTSRAPLWTEDPQEIMSHGQYAAGDDLSWLVSFRGKLFTWLGSRVVQYDGLRSWVPMGPKGIRTYGACVAGDWLIVTVQRIDTTIELWGFDGEGWWLLSSGLNTIWPLATGGAGTWDVVGFRSASTATVDLWRLRPRSTSADTYASAGAWVSPMLSTEGVARWSGVGAAFASPIERGNSGSADTVTVSLAYSIDGGQNWTTVDSETAFSPALGRVLELGADLAPAVSARYVQLRVSWSSVDDWAPVLERVWADHEPLPVEQPTRRVWEFDVAAADATIRRDGSKDPRTGAQIISALWDAWEGQRILDFQDIEGSLWTPASLPGLALWLRADTLSLLDGEAVSEWPDAMGGAVMVQASAAAQPAYRTAQLNGYPVVRFGGNDWLTLSSTLGIGAQPFSQYAIWKPSGAGQSLMLWANNAGLLVTDFDDDVGIFSGSALFNFNAHAFGQWHMVAGVHNGLSGRLDVDGGVSVTGSTGSGAPAGVLTVGAGINGIDRWVTGDLAELVITRTALSADQLALLFGYGAHKYALTGNLPGGHVYKAAAPRAEALVRIEAIREQVKKPGDRQRWGESIVRLQLDEV